MDDDDYVAGDPERSPQRPLRASLRYRDASPVWWSDLGAENRIAVIRWLQRGDAKKLLVALSRDRVVTALHALVLEGLDGGPVTGWGLRIRSGKTGGAPTKAARAIICGLREAIRTKDDRQIGALAGQAATLLEGVRSRRGRYADPMQVAMTGIAIEGLRLTGKTYQQATYAFALSTANRPPKAKGDDPHKLKNVMRLYDQFLSL
ncbi:hypothetical protein KM031_10180 [Gemmobacter fulvus]|uniref:Uncharacterized protein n=1 Tax=Gemmobacter fulvus TaxID=2840474 RepID=A0A975P512_9RHOB|nr:hypothetical protein [Gemmobacter fulvus]MBT9246652.1 hypothetical protein [Gemmobacter fulvus]QWK89238.1 hypothetical protein KM031_10180 [Gemmobacter fulvus]